MPGVDDRADAGHGERRLGDVGRQHHPAARVGLEDAVLLGDRQAGEQRDDLGVAELEGGERLGRVADLPLTAQEHEDVAGPPPACSSTTASHTPGSGRGPRSSGVARRRAGSGCRPGRCGPRPSITGAPPKCSAIARRVDGGRGDDDLEVGPPRQQLREVAEDEVDVEAPLVGLVDDDRVVAPRARGRGGARPAGCRRSSP